ncbi:Vitamin B12 ABC transporter, ATPase component BtuD [Candidatus Syntrophocurvum alkaliphilum]|uniref:Vitamin B12 ABC transporter, ATPase component BtuD n=1 Tax=Candidatus Syntrophocurvum alkaliphilum TaxID=2293317 RepID=A0A6I6DE48_9FIRM|nr:heme ABC transporter ATP-binding protein [Candidatus Syntrophocurvum alkaliphilum]QGT99447.1 Vitamin B12 ABC transporter, ATPase component BtuD [Candidatus Syntrophocurvum alkaliphilum]
MSISIKVDDISFNYGSSEVLKEINLSIMPGDSIGIIGPNGSGKSTLIKAMAASLKPIVGNIYLGEQDLFKLKPKKLAKELAVVPQDTTVNFNFSVWEIIMMGRMPHLGRFASENKEDYWVAEQAMMLTNTWHLRDKSIVALSGGERQRVILARALTQQPKVLLLDEPIAHLDINHQIELLALIKHLNETDNLTSITVLHDINLAARYCKKLILINEGRIYAVGTPNEVITQKNIQDVYGSKPLISTHPLTGVPQITIIESNFYNKKEYNYKDNLTIHIISGGGIGAPVIKELVQSGFKVTAGVLNLGDTDWQIAKMLGIEITEEAPFSPISEKSYLDNLKLVQNADLVLLLPIPIGSGNLLNLKILEESLNLQKPSFIIDMNNISYRDYSNGEATKITKQLLTKGVIDLSTIDDLWKHI